MKFTIVFGVIFAITILDVPATSNFVERIWNGEDAVPHSAPYMIDITSTATGSERHYCGGVLIKKRWILTAAHCVNIKQTLLIAGRHNIRVGNKRREQRRSAVRSVIHKGYYGCSRVCRFDIGLIYVNESYVFNEYVQPIQLPKYGKIPTGSAKLFGWGSISNTSTHAYPDVLQTTVQPILNFSKCQQFYGSLIDDTNFCSGPLDGKTSACMADSGSPLVQIDEQFRTIVVGLVSSGKLPCGQRNSPVVYVSVASFINWIHSNTN